MPRRTRSQTRITDSWTLPSSSTQARPPSFRRNGSMDHCDAGLISASLRCARFSLQAESWDDATTHCTSLMEYLADSWTELMEDEKKKENATIGASGREMDRMRFLETMYLRAHAHFGAERWEETVEDASNLIQLGLLWRGGQKDLSKREKRKEAVLRRRIQMLVGRAMYFRSLALFRLEFNRKALKEVNFAIAHFAMVAREEENRKDKKACLYPKAFFLRGRILKCLGKYEDALNAFERACRLDGKARNFRMELTLMRAVVRRRQQKRRRCVFVRIEMQPGDLSRKTYELESSGTQTPRRFLKKAESVRW